MDAPDPNKPPPLPPWATPWHAAIVDPPAPDDDYRPLRHAPASVPRALAATLMLVVAILSFTAGMLAGAGIDRPEVLLVAPRSAAR